MTEILRERDERGGYIVPTQRWWKFLFDTKTPTWQAFGRVVFVRAGTESEARASALAEARIEYPDAEIIETSTTPSTQDARNAFVAKRAKYAAWLENSRTGVPNQRGDV